MLHVSSTASPLALLLLFSNICLTIPGKSQGLPVLLGKLQISQNDTEKVNACYAISRFYWNQNADSVLLMGKKGLQLATAVKFEKGMALCNLTIGVGYGMKGMYPQSLDHHLRALQLSEKLGMRGLIGNDYTNIAIIYSNMRDYKNALAYYRRALQIAREFPNDNGVAAAYLNIGDVYTRELELDSAITYTLQALDLSEKAHDSLIQSISLSNLGDIYNKKLQPLKALVYLERSLQISNDIHDPDGVAYTNGSLAETYRLLGSPPKSIIYAQNSLKAARAIHAVETIKTSYHILYADYLAVREYSRALDYRNLEVALNDSIYTLEKEKQIKSLQSDYELQEKQHQVDLLQNKSLRQVTALQKERIRLYFIVGCTALLIVWAFFLTRSNQQRKRINRLLSDHNIEIVQRNGELAALNEMKTKLFSIIGHDLRSPVATLIGFVDLLKNHSLSPDQIRHFGALMGESLLDTASLLDNLLFWAKSQMNGLQVQGQAFDIVPVLKQNAQLIASRALKKKILLSLEAPQEPVLAFADQAMVDLVIRNLLDNALKFSGEGDTVRLSAIIIPEGVTISISDTGKGIPAGDQSRIFNDVSFTTAGTSQEKGSGLGLSLCKEMIEKNKGRIWFESTVDVGTTFTFLLPLAGYDQVL
jgi:two-component system sensor histidine kinase/response regulator